MKTERRKAMSPSSSLKTIYHETFVLSLLTSWLLIASTGQVYGANNKKALYLFENFTEGKVVMNNKAHTNALLNYDAANHLMKYKEGEETLILVNTQAVDTKKGAFGQITQTNVTVINTNHFKGGTYEVESRDVSNIANENEYWIPYKKSFAKFKNIKQLYKLFPDKEEDITLFIKQHSIEYKNVKDMLNLINYILQSNN
ncbi:MAG: hypothetical protein LUD02_00290 [Tannerellaceae bacterium]|nr:hypothetical protein [Tannerellaceae bacterium]